MEARPISTFRQRMRLAGVAVVLLAIVTGVSIGVMARDTFDHMRKLESAATDNAHWVLMQAEVEILRLQLAVSGVMADAPGARVEDVRRWFDVLYSRIGILEESPLYAPLLDEPDYAGQYRTLRDFLDRSVPLIDGPESELVAALPALSVSLDTMRGAARSMTLKAMAGTAAQSDLHRGDIMETLFRLAMLTLGLVLMLAALAWILAWQFRRSLAVTAAHQLAAIRLKTIVETSADGILVTNRGGWIIEVNPAAEAIVGYSRDEILGKRAVELLFPPDRAERQIQEIEDLLAHGGTRETGPVEMEGYTRDGRSIPIELSIGVAEVPPRPGGGRSGSAVVAVLRDVADRHRAERQLTDALDRARAGEKARAEFIAVMSHEMRTPLNGLLGAAELLSATRLDADQRRLLTAIRGAGDILLGHANAVLDLTRAESGQIVPEPARFDLDALVGECVNNQAGLAEAAGIGLVHIAPGGPVGEVVGDAGRVRQILLNLIGNAVKFTPRGKVTVESERHGETVEIRVIDTGLGIAEDNLERVFEDFVTLDQGYGRRTSGTGLGLGIARRLARAMGGEIGAESEPGDGSVFWLRLPLPAAAATAADRRPARDVLVIEDNPLNRFLFVRQLTDAGHRVVEAADGAEGVSLAAGRAFDVILTDISMPGMDGIEATRHIRAGTGPSRKARIVAVTAHALPEERARFHEAGINDCLVKPVSRATLLAAVEAAPSRAAPAALQPILDRRRLAELAGQIGPERMGGMISRLLAEGDAFAAGVAQGTRPDPRALHALAGSAATFGAAALQHALGELSRAPEAIESCLAELWAETRDALEAEVQGYL